jgi:hypothetical protein
MTEIKLKMPTVSVEFRHDGEDFSFGYAELPFVPMPGDTLGCEGARYVVVKRHLGISRWGEDHLIALIVDRVDP